MRKSLKSIINQTKLNLAKKIKKSKQSKNTKQNPAKKECELECFKRIKVGDIHLSTAVNADKLKKKLCDPQAPELEKAISRVLLNPLLQQTLKGLKEKYSDETVENFLVENEKNIQKNIKQKLSKQGKNQDKKNDKLEEESEVDSESDDDLESYEEAHVLAHVESNEIEMQDDNNKKLKINSDESSNESDNKEKPVPKTKQNLQQKTTQAQSKRVRKKEAFKKSVDPFFVDSSGQNYEAAVTAGASSCSEDEGPKTFEKKSVKQSLKRPYVAKGSVGVKPPVVGKNKLAREPQQKAQVSIAPQVEIKKPQQAKPDEADIHPSWKAKAQQRKTLIQDFQGTKIKFDD